MPFYGGGAIANLVFYWGKKYGQDKDAFFRNVDIFVFPTYYPNECFPLVLIEAMQQGLPCISTSEGGIQAIIEDGKTGLLVMRKKPADLADKIAWMIDHPKDRMSMGHNGKNKYYSEFTINAFEDRFHDILVKAVGVL